MEVAKPKTDPRTAASHGDLTTSGVAALVARDLLQRRLGADADKSFFRLLDLVALGTVAEGADVSRTNRTLVVQGLSAVGRGNRPAIELARRALAIGPDAVLRLEKTERLARVFASIPSTEGSSHGLDALLTRSTWAGDTQALLERFLAAEKGAGEEGPTPETSTAGSPVPEAEGDLRRGEVDAAFSRSLRAAMPFGRGNPSPLFRLPDYREGSLATRAEEAGRSTVDLMESGFPPRSEGQVPLVTFLPKGRGGLVVRFEGWAPGRRER